MKKVRRVFSVILRGVEAVIHDLLGPLLKSDDLDIHLRNRKVLGAGGRILIIAGILLAGFYLIKLMKLVVGIA
jgi:hypothetical protein